MIEAGAVGAVFIIKDLASPVLKALMDQFNSLQLSIDKTKLALAEMKFPPGLNRSINDMDKAILGVATSAETMGVKASAGFAKIDESVAVTQGRVAALKAEMMSLNAGVGRVGASGLPALPGGPSGLRGRSSHGSGSAALHSSMSAGPVGMRSGDGEMIAGAVTAFTIWESLKASADLQQVQENLKAGGVSNAEIEKATQQAFVIGQKYGLTARDVLQGLNEIRNPLNKGTTADEGVEDALRHYDTLAQAAVVLKGQGGKGGTNVARDIYDLVKSAEFRNAIGDKDFDKAINSMVKADVATGGIVTPRAWLQASQMLKGALPGLSDDYLYKIMPELMQEFGGARAGTASASLYQQIIAGQMRTTGLKLLEGIHTLDNNKVEFDTNGRVVRMKPGAYEDSATFKADPLKGIANLIEKMKAQGITAEGDQRDYFAQIFGNRNAAQMALTLGYQYARLERGAQGIENTKDIGPTSADLLNNNPYTQWDKFTSAATNAGAALGGNLMPGATDALNKLTAVTNDVGAMFRGTLNSSTFDDALGLMKLFEFPGLDRLRKLIHGEPSAVPVAAPAGLAPGTPTPWGPTGRVTREDLPYMQRGPMAANLLRHRRSVASCVTERAGQRHRTDYGAAHRNGNGHDRRNQPRCVRCGDCRRARGGY